MQIENLDLAVDDVTDVQWEDAAEFLGQETPRQMVPLAQETDGTSTAGSTTWTINTSGACC